MTKNFPNLIRCLVRFRQGIKCTLFGPVWITMATGIS